MGIGAWFSGNKKEKRHPLFPDLLPDGARLNGLVEFKPSCQTYFLINESKMDVRLPEDAKHVISAVSSLSLFGLHIHRAYLDTQKPPCILQFHYKAGELLDTILFNRTHEIFLDTRDAKEEWRDMIGGKDINSPTGHNYQREWLVDQYQQYGDTIDPVEFEELYFTEKSDYSKILNSAMLFARILEGGNEDDIEYLLASIRTGVKRDRVEIWVGTVIESNQVNFI